MERVVAANEVAFSLGFTGHSGHLHLEPLHPVVRPNSLTSLPDFILPPAFPQETHERMRESIEENYLHPEVDLDEFSVQNSGRWWHYDWFDRAKLQLEPSEPRFIVAPMWELPFRRSKNSVIWNPHSVEVDITLLMEGAQELGSMPRMPGPPKEFVRGSTNNRPFRPGGLEGSQALQRSLPEGAHSGDWVHEVIHGGHAQNVPPSSKNGLDLGSLKEYTCQWTYTSQQIFPEKDSIDEGMNKHSVQFNYLFKMAWEEDIIEGSSGDGSNQDEIENEDAKVDDIPETLENTILSESSDAEAELGGQSAKAKNHDKEVWALLGGNDIIVDHFHELVPDMAIDFPFELDSFQKEAIYYLERGESVFVAAHTSAGKTVVAEYAFALASKHCTRAVYTAPIKTISNQKYRDFSGKFDVGLLTGDVSLKPEASCLIMTTEILRSMLYKGADIIRDIEWVIFDEVHYVNDAERGVVWEEVIIMLPSHVNIVLLSATVPNTIEFADWIGRTKQKKIRVTGTIKRPVPLEHCLFFSGGLFKICENDEFLPQGFKAVKEVYKKRKSNAVGGPSGVKHVASHFHGGGQPKQFDRSNRERSQKHSGHQNAQNSLNTSGNQHTSGLRRSESSLWLSLINKLSKNAQLPVVIFCFSKNRVDKSADNMTGTDLTSNSEKSEIRVFCDKAFSRLKGSDRNLPQVVRVENLLKRGIGVHHAGLLPIVKEVVEMLFCRGVIKVLFSTETFAMGVNAPARTVVFDTLRKFDGKDFRKLLPGEYIQMAGRAGRRGLDNIGTVVIMCRDEIPEESDLKQVMVGRPTRLESQFRLTYTMILHLLRVEELKVEDMLKRSFAEFHAQKNLPEKERLLLQKLRQSTKKIECIKGEPTIEAYYEMASEAETYRRQIMEAILQLQSTQQLLSPGRLVIVKQLPAEDHLLGVVLKTPAAANKQYIILVLTTATASSMQASCPLNKIQENQSFQQGYFITPKGKRGTEEEYFSSITSRKGSGAINIKLPHYGSASGINYAVTEMENKDIISICNCKMKIDQVRLLEDASNIAYAKTVQELLKQKPDGNKFPPALDAVKDLKLKDMALVQMYHIYNEFLQNMSENKCHGCTKLNEHIMLMKEQSRHKEEVNALKFQMSDDALQQMPDFQGRIDVLKEIYCIDSDLVVQLKGRVACEMNSGEELICTECLFENQLDDLEPEEAVAIMSSLVFQQNNTTEPSLTPKLAYAKKRLYDTAIRLGQLQAQFKLSIDPVEYARDNLKFGLVEVVYEWAKGTPFADICELTDVPEGLIVRTIVRLDETCREFKNAASIMGNSSLYKKMETASNAIKRDIVFAASLYVTGV
ncbi:DExH-box ATP-dependent RNA helicase DExH11-like isoform X1 [Zingiber officinale]|uniref:DExH-box ATP-dependent RNA helicase DExH11-like isoform X1 n=1 Tax=Zingiber officinale TaxID=94328 RepID=UPI001C4D29A6|nr:DExH-box ATP-dependent RNA helicase DExH11-like isoform X1 [Zingiber officinale]